MSVWKLKDASDTWETVCERAYAGEPLTIMRARFAYGGRFVVGRFVLEAGDER